MWNCSRDIHILLPSWLQDCFRIMLHHLTRLRTRHQPQAGVRALSGTSFPVISPIIFAGRCVLQAYISDPGSFMQPRLIAEALHT